MKRALVVLGLGFGDEGKGTVVDWLARRATRPPLLVRWNGGPQAAHHVVTDDGRVHCFSQLGSGSFVEGARTHLGPGMVVDPYALHAEAAAFARSGVPGALGRLSIDPRAVLVTPWHAIVNRIREALRGPAAHGTTGRGVAEAKLGAAAVVAGQVGPGLDDALNDLREELRRTAAALIEAHPDPPEEARRLIARADDRDLWDRFLEAAHGLRPAGVVITAQLPAVETIVLEGAQGALLDRDHGFFPHVTPSRITRAAAEEAMHQMGIQAPVEVWGVLRGVHTRHGAGPFPSEDADLTARLPERHNREDGCAGRFRVGWLDGVLARWALAFAGPIDRLAITCLDRIESLPRRAVVDSWEPGVDLERTIPGERTELARRAVPVVRELGRREPLVEAAEGILRRRVDLESWGPAASDKRLRL